VPAKPGVTIPVSSKSGGPAGDQFPGSFQLLFAALASVHVCVSAAADAARTMPTTKKQSRAFRLPEEQFAERIATPLLAHRIMASNLIDSGKAPRNCRKALHSIVARGPDRHKDIYDLIRDVRWRRSMSTIAENDDMRTSPEDWSQYRTRSESSGHSSQLDAGKLQIPPADAFESDNDCTGNP
jgi:hypothetical protein